MPAIRASIGVRKWDSVRADKIWPESASIIPVIILTNVDLPARIRQGGRECDPSRSGTRRQIKRETPYAADPDDPERWWGCRDVLHRKCLSRTELTKGNSRFKAAGLCNRFTSKLEKPDCVNAYGVSELRTSERYETWSYPHRYFARSAGKTGGID